jgi:hypothetical protein
MEGCTIGGLKAARAIVWPLRLDPEKSRAEVRW